MRTVKGFAPHYLRLDLSRTEVPCGVGRVENQSLSKELGKVVVFEAGGIRWAVDLSHVREVVRVSGLTPLPNAIPEVAGMVNVRGEVVPVIECWWDGPASPFDKVMVIEGAGEVMALALERVHGLDAILAYDLQNLDSLSQGAGRFVSSLVLTRQESLPLLDVLLLVDSFKERRQVAQERAVQV